MINALFFTDATLHQIYLAKGEYNLIYQLPQVIYSMLISVILKIIIRFLAISEKSISEFKNKNSNKEEKISKDDLWSGLKCKFTFFFMISYLFYYFFGIILLAFALFIKILKFKSLKIL